MWKVKKNDTKKRTTTIPWFHSTKIKFCQLVVASIIVICNFSRSFCWFMYAFQFTVIHIMLIRWNIFCSSFCYSDLNYNIMLMQIKTLCFHLWMWFRLISFLFALMPCVIERWSNRIESNNVILMVELKYLEWEMDTVDCCETKPF